MLRFFKDMTESIFHNAYPIHTAIEQDNLLKLKKALTQSTETINQSRERGNVNWDTPVVLASHLAWKTKNYEALELLLEHGANPYILMDSIKSNVAFTFTALTSFESQAHYYHLIEILFEKGAKVDHSSTYDLLLASVIYASIDTQVVALLLKKGVNPNTHYDYLSTAMRSEKNTDKVKVLLQYGADPNQINRNGDAIIHESFYIEIKSLKTLFQYAANLDINLKNTNQLSAVECIVVQGFLSEQQHYPEIAEKLSFFIRQGAVFNLDAIYQLIQYMHTRSQSTDITADDTNSEFSDSSLSSDASSSSIVNYSDDIEVNGTNSGFLDDNVSDNGFVDDSAEACHEVEREIAAYTQFIEKTINNALQEVQNKYTLPTLETTQRFLQLNSQKDSEARSQSIIRYHYLCRNITNKKCRLPTELMLKIIDYILPPIEPVNFLEKKYVSKLQNRYLA